MACVLPPGRARCVSSVRQCCLLWRVQCVGASDNARVSCRDVPVGLVDQLQRARRVEAQADSLVRWRRGVAATAVLLLAARDAG